MYSLLGSLYWLDSIVDRNIPVDAVDRRGWRGGLYRAVRLHGDDLRVPEVFAGMAYAADAGELFSARLRIGAHLRYRAGVIDGAGAGCGAGRGSGGFHADRMRVARRDARAQRAAQTKVDAANRDRHQAPADPAKGTGADGWFVQHP